MPIDNNRTQGLLYVLDSNGNKIPLETDANGYLQVSIVATDVILQVDQVDIGNVVLEGSVSGNKAEVTSGLALKVDGSSVTQPVSLSTIPLATGAATSSAQTSAQTTLNSINTNTGNLDTPLSGLLKPSSTLTKVTTLDTITNPVAVTGSVSVSNLPATQPISGSVSFTAPQHVIVDSSSSVAVTGPLTDTQLRASAVPTSNSNIDVALSTRLKPADTLTGVTTVGSITNPVAVTGTFFPGTQPVSAVSLPLPSGASTESTLSTISTALVAGNSVIGDLGIANALNSAVELLQAIDFRLRELPTILTLSLNKGLPQPNVDTADNFQSDYFNGLN